MKKIMFVMLLASAGAFGVNIDNLNLIGVGKTRCLLFNHLSKEQKELRYQWVFGRVSFHPNQSSMNEEELRHFIDLTCKKNPSLIIEHVSHLALDFTGPLHN